MTFEGSNGYAMIEAVVFASVGIFLGTQALLLVLRPDKFGAMLVWLSRERDREPIAIDKRDARLVGGAGLLILAVVAFGFLRP